MTIAALRGPRLVLPRGPRGLRGDKPDHEIDGNRIRFQLPDGTWGAWFDTSITWRGAWSTAPVGGAYEQDDVVRHKGSSYIALSSHAPGASTEPGVGAAWATRWEIFAERSITGIPLTFSTTLIVGAADPAVGTMRVSASQQNTALLWRVDDLDANGAPIATILAGWMAGTSAVKGTVRAEKRSDPASWLVGKLTAASAGAGFTDLTITAPGGSAISPLANDDAIVLSFIAAGDRGEPGEGAADVLGGFPALINEDGGLRVPLAYIPASARRRVYLAARGLDNEGGEDETAGLNALVAEARANKLFVEGEGGVYGRSAVFGGQDDDRFLDTTLKDLNPNAPVREFVSWDGADRVILDNLCIDRNGAPTGGAPGTNIAFKLNGGSGHHLGEIEVFGDGKGTLISITGVSGDCRIGRLYAHDAAYDDDAATDDQIVGVHVGSVTDLHIGKIVADMIDGDGQAGYPGSYITRGFACSDTLRLVVDDIFARGAAQNIDVTGGPAPNRDFLFKRVTSLAAHAYGVACKNTASGGKIGALIVEDAGWIALLFSGPNAPGFPYVTGNIRVVDPFIRGTGARAFWEDYPAFAAKIADIAIWRSELYSPEMPNNIKIIRPRLDSGHATKRWALWNDAAASPKPSMVVGPSDMVAGTSGLSSGTWLLDGKLSFEARRAGAADQTSIASGVPTKIAFDSETSDPGGLFDPVNNWVTLPKGKVFDLFAFTRADAGAVIGGTYTVQLYRGGSYFRAGAVVIPSTSDFPQITCLWPGVVGDGGNYSASFYGTGAGTKTLNGALSSFGGIER